MFWEYYYILLKFVQHNCDISLSIYLRHYLFYVNGLHKIDFGFNYANICFRGFFLLVK